MSPPRPDPQAASFHRRCLLAAFAVVLAWAAVYLGWANPGLVDEPGHYAVIDHLAQRRPGLPAELPSLPGYHALVVLLADGQPSLIWARATTVAFALAGLACFAGAWRRLHGTPAGGATLLFALLPVLLPFTAMAYSDVPALTLVLAGCWAHFAGRRALAALLLALACVVRQTSLVWVAYLLALEALDAFRPRDHAMPPCADTWARIDRILDRGRWLLLLLATAAAVILHAGRLTVGTAHGNQAEANPATLHFAGLLVALLGLPTWLTLIRRPKADGASPRSPRRRPIVIAGLAGAGLLALLYRNGHAWNHPLTWPEEPSAFVLLRNGPLVALDHSVLLRLLSGGVIVGQLAGFAVLLARQERRRELWLLLPFTVALLLSNGLVEPRYLIPPLALGLLFYRPSVAGIRRQARWFALLGALLLPFVLTRLALW